MTKFLLRMFCGGVASLAAFAASDVFAAFSQFGDNKAILSVDINGGSPTDGRQTLGWDGSVIQPVGVDNNPLPPLGNGPPFATWTSWGGPTNSGGDGTDLPFNAANNTILSIQKVFPTSQGPVTATIRSGHNDPSFYNGNANINSRDRGDLGQPTSQNLSGIAMYRDLIFNAGNVTRGTNFLEIEFTGLEPGKPYHFNLYAYDNAGGTGDGRRKVDFSATAPTPTGNVNSMTGVWGWWNGDGTSFEAPDDMVEINWAAPALILSPDNNQNLPGPAFFKQKADGSGTVTFYAWGRSGNPLDPANNNFADTTYFNGFQIAVPEPGSMILGMFGLAGIMLGRRRD